MTAAPLAKFKRYANREGRVVAHLERKDRLIMKANDQLKRIYFAATTGLFLLSLVFGCHSDKQSAWQKEARAQKSPDLKNITLRMTTDMAGEPAKLVNGDYQGDHLSVHVLRTATADFNQDGLIDGAVIIWRNSGGSGNFREICLMSSNGKEMVQSDQVFIGDRIKIVNLNIDENIIMVDYMDRGEGDAFSINPYIKKKIQYRVRGNKLEQLLGDKR